MGPVTVEVPVCPPSPLTSAQGLHMYARGPEGPPQSKLHLSPSKQLPLGPRDYTAGMLHSRKNRPGKGDRCRDFWGLVQLEGGGQGGYTSLALQTSQPMGNSKTEGKPEWDTVRPGPGQGPFDSVGNNSGATEESTVWRTVSSHTIVPDRRMTGYWGAVHP